MAATTVSTGLKHLWIEIFRLAAGHSVSGEDFQEGAGVLEKSCSVRMGLPVMIRQGREGEPKKGSVDEGFAQLGLHGQFAPNADPAW